MKGHMKISSPISEALLRTLAQRQRNKNSLLTLLNGLVTN